MACKIDIKNTINKSIENKVDFDFWGYSLSQAKNLTKFINDIWNTNILSYLQRDGRGSYQILKDESKIDEAVEIEYNKQLKAETKIAEIDREINERDLGIDEFGDSNPSYERVDYKNVSYQNSQFKPDNNDINTKYSTAEEKAKTIEQSNTLFGLNTQNQEQLEFHLNTLNAVSQFLENAGIETRLISEFLSQDGNVVEGAIAAANFIEGTVDIIDDLEKGRAEAWNKLPEEAAHWWYRLLDKNSELKDALLTSALTDRKEEELRNSLYGETYKDGPKVIGKLALDSNGNVTSKPALSAIREEAIGQLIAEAIKRIETKNAAPEDYSFFKKFLEWINSIIDIFKTTNQDPFEVAAMKILSSDMSDLMTWEEYRKVNNIVNFADVLTEQSVAPVDYTLIEDIGFIGSTFMEDNYGNATSGYRFHFKDSNWVQKYGNSSPSFYTQQELDNWVSVNIKEHDIRQKQQIQEVRDNQIFFDRLLNKTFRKKSKFLPKTLRKYYDIIDAQNLNQLREWNISQELQQITKKLSEQEKKQIIETNGYTNIAPTLKVLPDLLKKYGRKTTPEIIKQEIEITNKLVKNEITKEQATELRQKLENKKKGNSIVLSEPIKIDGAKKQELSILNGIREMIKLENPSLKSITAEEFVAEAHNWLKTNYLLGFANETGINGEISSGHPGYNVSNTFVYYDKNRNISKKDLENYRNLTEEQIRNLSPEERQMYLDIAGIGNRQYDIYHNKISIRFNDFSHFAKNVRLPHFQKRIDGEEGIIPSAWGNLTYFYTGKNKWKDAVLLHEIQNDNIEFLREYKSEKVDLETSLGRYLQQLNTDLLDNITQIESGGKKIIRRDSSEEFIKTHLQLNYQLLQLKDLPLEQGLLQLKQNLNEKIELYKSDNSVRNNIDKAQEVVDEAYSRRRIFQDFQKRGGIKSLLTKEELQNLEDILKRLNTEEVEGEAMWLPEENQFEPGFPSIRNLERKKRDFSNEVIAIQTKINDKLRDMYGDNVPLINLTAPAKPRTKSQELNENVNWLLAYSEKKILDNLSKTIEESKKNYIRARNVTNAYNFNVQLSKITLEQWTNLVENYKYNVDLLNRLIDEQAKKDIKAKSSEINPEDNPLITSQFYKTLSPTNLPSDSKVYTGNEFHFGTFEFGYGTIWTSEKFPNNLYIEISNSNIGVIKKSDLKDAILKSNSKENRKIEQQSQFESLKQKALDKKAELEKNYGKIEEEVKQTLEIEMNYFTPLVHHLIQKHINQYGKDFPMYFSGYQITKLTQNNDRTAWIYAGKDEINIVELRDFRIGDKGYSFNADFRYIPLGFTITDYSADKYLGNSIRYANINGEYSKLEDSKRLNITKQEYEKAKQEYEKAYQQATERRAKEIKFIAASNIGIIKFSDFEGTIQGVSEETNVKKLSDKQLEEGIKALNEFKKIPKSDPRSKYNYKSNADVVIEKLLEINNNEPIETGAIYNAMSQISGVKLVWQDKIEGLQGNTGGYLVDLSNYNYNTPILYGLNTNKVGSQQDIEGFKDFVQGKQFQKLTQEEKVKTIEQVTKEHRSIAALKDLSAKLAHRIGGKVEFENNPNADWKGYNQGMKSVLNEAYMTPDTPFHEILAHPIIRAIKNGNKFQIEENLTEKDADKIIEKNQIIEKNGIRYLAAYDAPDGTIIYRYDKTIQTKPNIQLYQNLLKELETGRGKEVFEQVKRDYNRKKPLREKPNPNDSDYLPEENQYEPRYYSEQDYLDDLELWEQERDDVNNKYTLEEQQEEAIVTLLGLMAADKLDAKKDASLISKLKALWKQISDFVKSLLTGNISENEINNIIENEVTYTDEENKPCAKDGIRSSKFTKGSQWEIVKDLKGYPSHAQGGVDIKLGKDGFSFTGKDGEIKAANGLVLPKIK